MILKETTQCDPQQNFRLSNMIKATTQKIALFAFQISKSSRYLHFMYRSSWTSNHLFSRHITWSSRARYCFLNSSKFVKEFCPARRRSSLLIYCSSPLNVSLGHLDNLLQLSASLSLLLSSLSFQVLLQCVSVRNPCLIFIVFPKKSSFRRRGVVTTPVTMYGSGVVRSVPMYPVFGVDSTRKLLILYTVWQGEEQVYVFSCNLAETLVIPLVLYPSIPSPWNQAHLWFGPVLVVHKLSVFFPVDGSAGPRRLHVLTRFWQTLLLKGFRLSLLRWCAEVLKEW